MWIRQANGHYETEQGYTAVLSNGQQAHQCAPWILTRPDGTKSDHGTYRECRVAAAEHQRLNRGVGTLLVLSRRFGERIRVRVAGRDIWLEVVAFRNGQVRLGFIAPPDVQITREELLTPQDLEARRT